MPEFFWALGLYYANIMNIHKEEGSSLKEWKALKLWRTGSWKLLSASPHTLMGTPCPHHSLHFCPPP